MNLEAKSLTLAVPGRTLIARLDLEIAPGQCWAVLGANGVGKSSLLSVLAGLRSPGAGTVDLDGRPLDAYSRRELATNVGILLQDAPESFWGSTADYVALGGFARQGFTLSADAKLETIVSEALERLDLRGHVHQPYRTLSGGERQRARLAQLLVQAPRVYLLDEPLNHLDLRHQLAVMSELRALADGGAAVVMALHEPWLAARYCDRALLLYDAQRFFAGPARALLARGPLEALYGCSLDAYAEAGRRLFPDELAHQDRAAQLP